MLLAGVLTGGALLAVRRLRERERVMAAGEQRASAGGRLISTTTWAVLLLGLWLWGRDVTEGRFAPTTGDGRSAARPWTANSAAAARGAARRAEPRLVDIDSLGVRRQVMPRGVDAPAASPRRRTNARRSSAGTRTGPPRARRAPRCWWGTSTPSPARRLLPLSTAEPGGEVRVTRADGSVAEFTVGDVEVVERGDFDAERATARVPAAAPSCG